MSESNYKLLTGLVDKYGPTEQDRTPVLLFLQRLLPRLLTAPASTAVRFHHARYGGLLEHTLEVINMALSVAAVITPKVPAWDIVLAGILHDIHKVGDASGQPNWVPNFLKSGKRSDAIPYERNESRYLIGVALPGSTPLPPNAKQLMAVMQRNLELIPEGEFSLGLVAALAPDLYNRLNPDVLFAVRHHDGYYGGARRELTGNETPLMLVLHFADMWSSRGEGWKADAVKTG